MLKRFIILRKLIADTFALGLYIALHYQIAKQFEESHETVASHM